MSGYLELHARSAFSFLRGASRPEQLAEAAAQMDLPAVALCDRDGVYGAPRFFATARESGLRPIVGAEITLEDGSILPLLVENRPGYQNLCRLLTRAHLRAAKNKSSVRWEELPEFAEGLVALTGDEEGPLQKSLLSDDRTKSSEVVDKLRRVFGPQNLFVEIQRHHLRGENRVNTALVQLAETHRLPLLATNGVLYATPAQRAALDVFTCIRGHTHLDTAGTMLARNSERHLKNAAQMRELFSDLPSAVDNTVRLGERLQFNLANLGYEFPSYPVAEGETMAGFLRQVTEAGARGRYAGEIPEKVRGQLDQELALIGKLGFAGYFLIVWDIVRFCRENDIMAQGRGSAANSSVCFCLGITNVDPLKFHTLFERFLSEGRKSWPDIDIDLPSGDRRERVIQEIYRRHGRGGAAMTANVITYRGRSAAREIGKALDIPADVLDRFSNLFANGDFPHTLDLTAQMESSGLPNQHPRARAFATLYQQIHGLPRHLGQHSGGMIICQDKLDSIVPLENASMPNRVVAQWDKDDCEDLGIVKVDFLGLGMMSVLQETVALCRERGRPVDLAHLPENDAATFAMICEADTMGVFQIESRAQMATLPRMKPENFYDLVIEVAIIRPGPIQGNLMHPYLARRAGRQPVTYYDERLKAALEPVLGRTLGVPLFQEQLLQLAMVLADFSGSEAEELRRALSSHRSPERMNSVEKKLRAAMRRKGHAAGVIDQIVAAISSFALYGFPESHAISFAHLAYASAYLKRHRAVEFYAGLLNNQPMGFYSPATIVKDARRHGLKIKHLCVQHSEWFYTVENNETLRMGFCAIRGVRREHTLAMLDQRKQRPFDSLEDFQQRAPFNKEEMRGLAEVGALNGFAAHRREALWEVEKNPRQEDLFSPPPRPAQPVRLAICVEKKSASSSPDSGDRSIPTCPLLPMTPGERLRADYQGLNLTTGPHPMALIRKSLPSPGFWRATDLPQARHGQTVRIAGNVICRQRPGTAKGFVFVSLEDETGVSNAIVTPQLFEKFRLVITEESFLVIEGVLQNSENVIVIRARKIERLAHENLSGSHSHDFR